MPLAVDLNFLAEVTAVDTMNSVTMANVSLIVQMDILRVEGPAVELDPGVTMEVVLLVRPTKGVLPIAVEITNFAVTTTTTVNPLLDALGDKDVISTVVQTTKFAVPTPFSEIICHSVLEIQATV